MDAHVKRRIAAFNVDVGLLYTASVIAESATLCAGKVLPGQYLYWRDDPMIFARPLAAVCKLYRGMKLHDTIVSCAVPTPHFFKSLRARAHKMF